MYDHKGSNASELSNIPAKTVCASQPEMIRHSSTKHSTHRRMKYHTKVVIFSLQQVTDVFSILILY